ncbi:hypothetical protein CANARDRAFT_29144 [[Candida] arabinofermentans NRRL YB-2248]|nr:hypothetical protein CANARDRAFT_29144 [[Candida] arabinofermentans NRRL YB-2248]
MAKLVDKKVNGRSTEDLPKGKEQVESSNQFNNNSDSEDDFISDDDDDDDGHQFLNKVTKKKQVVQKFENRDSEDDESDEILSSDEEGEAAYAEIDDELQATADEIAKQLTEDSGKSIGKKKIKKLTPEQLAKEEKKIAKTGVIYLSSIPPYMKPAKLRQIMSKFGKVGRLYLKQEEQSVYKSRIKTGGNKKKKYDEGWCEFINKKDAKLATVTLNGNTLGGKKGSFYYDDVMNVKYLKGFKWSDLTNAMNKEIEVRENRLQAELSQSHKLNKSFIKNVETNKMIENIKKKRKTDDDDGEVDIRRNFKQRSVTTNRAGADDKHKDTNNSSTTANTKLNNVLNSIF